jgi:hypothetical protein
MSHRSALFRPICDDEDLTGTGLILSSQGDQAPHLRRDAMVTWLMRRAIGAFERTWNYDARYLYDILEASPRAARLF